MPAFAFGFDAAVFVRRETDTLRSRQVKTGCDRTYVGRMLRLTILSPDIIEAILRGDVSRRCAAKTDEPDGLSLEKLQKNLPVRWDEQRKT